MQEHAVDAVGARIAARRERADLIDDPVHPGEARRGIFEPGQRLGADPAARGGQGLAQLLDPRAAVPDHREHRTAQNPLQPPRVQTPAARRELVDHGHGDRAGPVRIPGQHLEHEGQAAAQGRGIEHQQQRVRRGLAREAAVEHALRDLLVERLAAQAVGARKVDHADVAVQAQHAALAALDRHPRVVADARARAGQRVEERGLPRVGGADQGDTRGRARVHRERLAHGAPPTPPLRGRARRSHRSDARTQMR